MRELVLYLYLGFGSGVVLLFMLPLTLVVGFDLGLRGARVRELCRVIGVALAAVALLSGLALLTLWWQGVPRLEPGAQEMLRPPSPIWAPELAAAAALGLHAWMTRTAPARPLVLASGLAIAVSVEALFWRALLALAPLEGAVLVLFVPLAGFVGGLALALPGWAAGRFLRGLGGATEGAAIGWAWAIWPGWIVASLAWRSSDLFRDWVRY